jgi:neurofibromin 1
LDIDDDIFYQILVAFKGALQSSEEQDSAAVMSILRCITRVIPGLKDDSRYLPHIFWLAVALLQSTYLPFYEEAAQLLEATLETLARQGFFEGYRMSSVLLDARASLLDITNQLDNKMGLSFDAGFSFSLASILFRGVRPPSLQPVARKVLRTILRISAEASASCKTSRRENGQNNSIPPLDPDILGYFLALLPFACTQAAYRQLLRDACVSSRWWPSPDQDGEETSAPTVNAELFGFSSDDPSTPLLVISFVFAMLDSYPGSEQEKGFLFNVLGRLAIVYPDPCSIAVVHFLTNPKYVPSVHVPYVSLINIHADASGC